MKTLVAIILALGVGFAAAYVIVSKQKDAQLEKLRAQPPPVVTAAPTAAPVEKVIMAAAPAAPAEESAQDILDDLLNIKLGTGSARNTGLRMVVFKLETLTQRGTLAVPAIRSFIGRNVDVDYNQQDNSNNNTNQADAGVVANNDQNNTNSNNGNGGNGGNNRRNRNRNGNNGGGFGGFGGGGGFAGGFGGGRGGARRARNLQTLQADWVVPPSLRLGLVGTLKEIGGAESEQALAEMLSSTGRGVEVAYLAVILEEIAPGKYRDAAIAAAKELLMNPPAVDSPDSLDQLSKSYLYGVLEFYKDASFAVNAQQMLVGADGRLDQDALDYLSTVLKDQSVSALYSAYENQNLTNQFDKMALGREILNYVGQNPQANQMFTETLNNPDLDSRLKLFSIVQVAGGFGQGGDTSTDPQVVGSKITFLQSLESQYANDPQISGALTATVTAMQNGTTPDMRTLFGNNGGQGGGGNRRQRQNQNNNGGGD
ncbi:MAG TPA: hypothetical protein VHY30_09420 [Verrucomicrobiae bacterium]|jgi:hypothetical protein|nr:hypothetical protein [Verrucomicrobiae bacterium]